MKLEELKPEDFTPNIEGDFYVEEEDFEPEQHHFLKNKTLLVAS